MKWLAYHLPQKVLYWAIIRVWSKITTTKFTNKTPDEVSVFDALKELSR